MKIFKHGFIYLNNGQVKCPECSEPLDAHNVKRTIIQYGITEPIYEFECSKCLCTFQIEKEKLNASINNKFYNCYFDCLSFA